MSAWPRGAQRWSEEHVAADVAQASADFRARRLGEPLSRYLAAFDSALPHNEAMIGRLIELLAGEDTTLLRNLWADEPGRTAFRYLGAPPISMDDLETLAEAKLNATTGKSKEATDRLLSVLRAILDPRRFPWVGQHRQPTASERKAAVVATTSLVASQRLQTLRRGDEKSMIEGAVGGLLIGLGWTAAPARPARGIQNLLNDSPPARTFLKQCNLATDNADVVIRLDDGRLLAIECKGSNSSINSRKRLNKEAVQNARAWLTRFGDQVVPAVALQGVFNERYVLEAQSTPMLIFWSHRLEDIQHFVEQAR